MGAINKLSAYFLRTIMLIIGVLLYSLTVKADNMPATQPLVPGEKPYSHLKLIKLVPPVANSVLIALADDTSNGTTLQFEL